MNQEQRRRVVRALLTLHGRGFADAAGLQVTNNPAALFRLLCLAVLCTGGIQVPAAMKVTRALFHRKKGTSAAELARSSGAKRAEVLHRAGYPEDPKRASERLDKLAQVVVERYHGDLRRLRAEAKRDPTRERELLKRLPAVTDAAVDIFFRDVQPLWAEVAPFADRQALSAARRLGLASNAEELAGLARAGAAEKLSWMVGALVLVDLYDEYDKVLERSRGG